MQATGIVAEYNPFHNGHLYHLQESKRLTGQPVIVVMSGSVMQRGEPAVLSKWLRARLAAENGASLVLELPAAFSLRSAEFFAKGAVQILQATGCVTHLSCGAENPAADFTALAKAAALPENIARLQSLLKEGVSYAAAWEQVLPQARLRAPNDILALEYSKALLNTSIPPVFVRRRDGGYNSTAIDGSIASATAIRQALSQNDCSWRQAVPSNVSEALTHNHPGYNKQLLWQLISYRLRLLTPDAIAQRCQCSEGLEYALKQTADCLTLEEAINRCAGKRYTAGRVRRLLLQLLLDKPRSLLEQRQPAYLRVLAFDDTGRRLLKIMKKTASLPIITKVGRQKFCSPDAPMAQQLDLETAVTDIWSLLQNNPALNRPGNDFYISPRYVQNLII